jgi:phosphoglycerate dehydrogenase-like enzyme
MKARKVNTRPKQGGFHFMIIKLGIIGFGGMGKWHAQNAPRAGVEIAAEMAYNSRRFFQRGNFICDNLKISLVSSSGTID